MTEKPLTKQEAIGIIKDIIKKNRIPKEWLKDKMGEKWGFTSFESEMHLIFFLIDRFGIKESDLK